MNDETRMTNEEIPPPVEPLPQVGGSYRRESDGSLTPIEGPGLLPENQPPKPTKFPQE